MGGQEARPPQPGQPQRGVACRHPGAGRGVGRAVAPLREGRGRWRCDSAAAGRGARPRERPQPCGPPSRQPAWARAPLADPGPGPGSWCCCCSGCSRRERGARGAAAAPRRTATAAPPTPSRRASAACSARTTCEPLRRWAPGPRPRSPCPPPRTLAPGAVLGRVRPPGPQAGEERAARPAPRGLPPARLPVHRTRGGLDVSPGVRPGRPAAGALYSAWHFSLDLVRERGAARALAAALTRPRLSFILGRV